MPSSSSSSAFASFAPVAAAIAAVAVAAAVLMPAANASSDARVLPPYAGAAPAVAAGAETETAIVAGGCFWGVQGVFQHVKGVSGAVSGYAGGDRNSAKYELVGGGATGHAEAVQITYDPRQINYARILQIYFSVAHDPTQLNRQGPDSGTQYRSAVFPTGDEQARVAQAYIAQLGGAKSFPKPIVTRIEAGKSFYPAEGYHQDFMVRNPGHPYIVVNDAPKVDDLKRLFPDLYRADPVLVSRAAAKGV